MRAPCDARSVSKTFEHATTCRASRAASTPRTRRSCTTTTSRNKRQLRILDTHPALDVDDHRLRLHLRRHPQRLRGPELHAGLPVRDAEPADARPTSSTPRVGPQAPSLDGHIWVPIDDNNTMLYTMKYGASEDNQISDEEWWADEDQRGEARTT